ncbi:MAG: hypothetical protein OXC63_06560 [Aestuariivita sp.]|nr:hypothetical protein [Aestuariivita sp.]MCY4348123.1 hypothetical protein [Aestuariivita sp.]
MELSLIQAFSKTRYRVITWHKGFDDSDWSVDLFTSVQVPDHGPVATRPVSVLLAEQHLTLAGGLKVRQVPLMTTDFHRSIAQIAGALYARWAEENVFKSLKYAFNLDALAVPGLDAIDPEKIIVNPVGRRLRRTKTALKQRLGAVRNRLADQKAENSRLAAT